MSPTTFEVVIFTKPPPLAGVSDFVFAYSPLTLISNMLCNIEVTIYAITKKVAAFVSLKFALIVALHLVITLYI